MHKLCMGSMPIKLHMCYKYKHLKVKLTSFVGVSKCMPPVIYIAHVESHRQDFLALRSCETIGTGSSAFIAHKSTYCLRRLNAMGFLPPAKSIK